MTIHTNAYYILNPESGENKVTKICSISEDARHTAPAVFAHLKPLFQRFKDLGIKTLLLFTDGPTGQYRNKTAFFLMGLFAKEYGITKLIWNYWESGHGKNIIDGLGAILKMKGDNKVCQGADITNAATFIEVVKEVKIELFEVKSDDINEVEKLTSRKLQAAPGTFQVHQVIWRADNEKNLYLRKRSCTHNDDFSPCKLCDLTRPKYCPTQITPPKKVSKKQISKTSKKNAVIVKKMPKKPAVKSRKNKDGDNSLAPGAWIAINEEGSEWHLAKVESSQKVCDREIFSVSNVLTKLVAENSKHFTYGENEDEVQQVFKDDIICLVKSPKALKKPKNSFSIKEYNYIEKLLKNKIRNNE